MHDFDFNPKPCHVCHKYPTIEYRDFESWGGWKIFCECPSSTLVHEQIHMSLILWNNSRKNRHKASYVGAPAIFKLDLAISNLLNSIRQTCPTAKMYLVGSALDTPHFRDVDIRCILSDEEFDKMFPDAGEYFQYHPIWLASVVEHSDTLSKACGLTVDFQFQAQRTQTQFASFRTEMGLNHNETRLKRHPSTTP